MELIKTILSWIHTISASFSLVFGIIVLLGVKGNIRHKKIGLWYFYAMLLNNITALFILNSVRIEFLTKFEEELYVLGSWLMKRH